MFGSRNAEISFFHKYICDTVSYPIPTYTHNGIHTVNPQLAWIYNIKCIVDGRLALLFISFHSSSTVFFFSYFYSSCRMCQKIDYNQHELLNGKCQDHTHANAWIEMALPVFFLLHKKDTLPHTHSRRNVSDEFSNIRLNIYGEEK